MQCYWYFQNFPEIENKFEVVSSKKLYKKLPGVPRKKTDNFNKNTLYEDVPFSKKFQILKKIIHKPPH